MKAFSRSNVTVNSNVTVDSGRIGTPRAGRVSREGRWAKALAAAERLEGDDGVGVLNAGNHLHLLVDEMADVGLVIDIELDQQVVMAGGGVDLRGDLGL